ncbi:hypothetical protein [Microvirga sp. TS319]|uniref:hypothetical protein n=1 Tax=Microvirga sp. TS319 TaxID=3241165 RepID=UPI00351AABC9
MCRTEAGWLAAPRSVAYTYDMDGSEDQQPETWSEYQPRDPEITGLVQQLAANGLVLGQIEDLIKQALKSKLAELHERDSGYDDVAMEVLEDLRTPPRQRQH